VNKCFREFASRREADRLVEDGRVAVNGQPAVSGQRVFAGDQVTLDGRPVRWEALQAELAPSPPAAAAPAPAAGPRPPAADAGATDVAPGRDDSSDGGCAPLPFEERFVYVKYWKPRGVVCTADRSIRGNIVDAVRHPSARLFTVGRLDKDSTGVILLTSDGRLPNAVLRAREGHAKVYAVTADQPVADEDCAALAAGVVITTVAQRDRGVGKELTAATLPCGVRRGGDGGRRLLITLREGRNRQIRRMLEALGYDTLRLHRVTFMGIGLEGMEPGEWRALGEGEMAAVRRAVRDAQARVEAGEDEGERWEEDKEDKEEAMEAAAPRAGGWAT
jgi:pseudouridine synthase